MMQIYKVGGAVRDRLLGREVSEIDWVVVGASAEQMLELGYRPVGADFPVFLHPQTGEEYALARTERKSGRGSIRAREISFQLRSGVSALSSPDSLSSRISTRVSGATLKPNGA